MAGVFGLDFFERSFQLFLNTGIYTPTDCILHLFDNDYTPTSGTTVADVDEPTDATYLPVTIPGGGWTIGNVGAVEKAICALQNFTFTAGDNIYGWFLTDSGGGLFVAGERFAGAPVVIPAFGGVLGVSVELDLQSP